ncbi:hypothetical protein RJ53_06290 [Methanocalculus chunghsingensis]|uniref:Tetratricopeptide repeat protein n=1 Tax=Methanocalculus chunghsingensis TaxID=156457 RepID=A0A8J7W682_9EURY|nr:tetratricopeptide repeat protein [Methanocalculus chunghsingensis]MBR1369124.1 hypothetical protein [Methanocalculus chunghsingensis]
MKILHLIFFFIAICLFVFLNPLGISFPSDIDAAGAGTFSLIGDGFVSMNQSGIAASCYSYALHFDQNETVLMQKQAEAFYSLHEYEEAAALYSQAASIDPSSSELLTGLGRCYLMAGDPQAAENAFTEALSLSPADPAALHSRAVTLLAEGRYTEAISDLDALIATYPDSGRARMYRGDAYIHMTQRYETEMQETHSRPGSGFSEGKATATTRLTGEASNAYMKAMEDYQKAMELDPRLTPVITMKVMAQYQSQVETYAMIIGSL